MSDPYVGEIRMFGFNFAPIGWAFCSGQLLPIDQNEALFSLIGTFYGGDGISTFGLPDLRSRVAMSFGQGNGLTARNVGDVGGTETVILTSNEMPNHAHTVEASGSSGTTARPGGAVLAKQSTTAYGNSTDGTTMNAGMIATAGGNQPHSNIQPFLAVNFCIALVGIFPARS